MRKNTQRIKTLVAIAMFSALAYASMFVIKIPVQFLDLEIKDSITVLCGLIFGPLAAVSVSVVVPLIQLMTISSTGWYGLVMNILSSLSFSLTVSLIYKYRKTFYGAITALISGVLAMTAVMMLANLFITPFYMGVPRSDVVSLIPTLLLPFNLVKAILNAAIVLMFYKPVSTIMKGIGVIETSGDSVTNNTNSIARNIVVTVISAVIIVLSLVIVFFVIGK
ncbi:MAG: ECF transporter S component [Clostridia bacterium]|nr:ECF transporter S component [Clostridia bacterium]